MRARGTAQLFCGMGHRSFLSGQVPVCDGAEYGYGAKLQQSTKGTEMLWRDCQAG